MTGVEPSSQMLDIAKRRCDKVRWIVGSTEVLGDFQADLAIMTGHVAQFFLDDESWRAALASIHDALKVGGRLAFESRNPSVLPFAKWPTESSHRRLNDPTAGSIEWWTQGLEFENERARYELHYLFLETGEELVSVNELRFRSQDEITNSLLAAGFSIENIYGDWDRSPLEPTSKEMIFVAKRD